MEKSAEATVAIACPFCTVCPSSQIVRWWVHRWEMQRHLCWE
ncbi:MAG: hypothetical protein ACLBM1_08075 [Cuspidothrix sp.]